MEDIKTRCRAARESLGFTNRERFLEALKEQGGVEVSLRTLERYEDAAEPVVPRADYIGALARMSVRDPTWLIWGTASPVHAQLATVRAMLQEACDLLDGAVSPVDADTAFRAVSAVRNGKRLDRRRRASG